MEFSSIQFSMLVSCLGKCWAIKFSVQRWLIVEFSCFRHFTVKFMCVYCVQNALAHNMNMTSEWKRYTALPLHLYTSISLTRSLHNKQFDGIRRVYVVVMVKLSNRHNVKHHTLKTGIEKKDKKHKNNNQQPTTTANHIAFEVHFYYRL